MAKQLTIDSEEACERVLWAGPIGEYLFMLLPTREADQTCSNRMWDIANIAYLIELQRLPVRCIRAPGIDTHLRLRVAFAPRGVGD